MRLIPTLGIGTYLVITLCSSILGLRGSEELPDLPISLNEKPAYTVAGKFSLKGKVKKLERLKKNQYGGDTGDKITLFTTTSGCFNLNVFYQG